MPKLWILIALTLFFLCRCGANNNDNQTSSHPAKDSIFVTLEISFFINQAAYQFTNYGDPPQLAIWIEDTGSEKRHTVWVTRCAGKNEWRGKVNCPVALPVWESRFRAGKINDMKDTIDIITGATPRSGKFVATIQVPSGSQWDYYIEVNAAGDYNETFTYWSATGSPDSEGNGQPSIIYKGSIVANGVNGSSPKLVGRTDQRRTRHVPLNDITGITSAAELLRTIQVISRY